MKTKICKWYAVCPMNDFFKHDKIDKKVIEQYCFSNWENCIRYQMEEKGEYHPDNMLPNGEIDENLS